MSHGGGGDNSTSWTLDLDAKEAIESAEKLHGSLDAIGEVESIGGMIETMGSLGIAIGAVGAAVFAIKETFDLVFEAEQIHQVEQAFDSLAEHAGLSGQKIKHAMEEASGGMLSEDEVLKSANRGMVELGSNAARMSEVMQLARQATLVMGGDLKNNFDGILQAIASGNARALKNMGIMVDQKKAYEDYARSIGVAASELNKMGQQHAMLNAVLEQGAKSFNGVDTSVSQATNTWAQFKAAMKDTGDAATLAFEKIAGGGVRASVNSMAAIAKSTKLAFKDWFGSGAEKDEAHLERMKNEIDALKTKIDAMKKNSASPLALPGETNLIPTYVKSLEKLETEYKKVSGTTRQLAAQDEAVEKDKDTKITASNEINLKARAKNQLAYQQQLLSAQEAELAEEKKAANSSQQMQRINAQMKTNLLKQSQLAQQKINQQEGLSAKQKEDLKVQLAKGTQLKLKAIDRAEEQDELQALKNLEEQNKNSAAGFEAAWRAGSQAASNDMTSFAKLGETSFNALSSNAVSAFKAMGDGSKSAGDAMKGFLLNTIGQIAEAQGTEILMASIFPPNPVGLAAGGALIAFGAALSGMAGGGDSGSSVPAASGGGGGGDSVTAPSVTSNSPTMMQQTPQKTVSLTVSGNYYDSNETKTQLMDMIRSSTDATDFNYTKVGGKK